MVKFKVPVRMRMFKFVCAFVGLSLRSKMTQVRVSYTITQLLPFHHKSFSELLSIFAIKKIIEALKYLAQNSRHFFWQLFSFSKNGLPTIRAKNRSMFQICVLQNNFYFHRKYVYHRKYELACANILIFFIQLKIWSFKGTISFKM